MLNARGRLQLLIKPERWFANLLEAPNVMLAELTPELLIASSYLPGKPPNDPTDRILAATARDLGAVLITRDYELLGYGKQGIRQRWSVSEARSLTSPRAARRRTSASRSAE